MHQSFEHLNPLHWRYPGQTGAFTSYSLYLGSPVVDDCTFSSRFRYTIQGLSEDLAGTLLVVRHLFHKTGFKLHVRGKHGGWTIDEERMISIALRHAFDLTSVVWKTSCESSSWHYVIPPNCAWGLEGGGVHWIFSRHLTDSKSECPRYPLKGEQAGGSNIGPLHDLFHGKEFIIL